MIELTQEQIKKVADEINVLADKNLSDVDFKAKVNALGITGSDEDMKAFKAQIHELVAKKGELVKLSEDELSEAVGGLNTVSTVALAAVAGVSVVTLTAVAAAVWFAKKFSISRLPELPTMGPSPMLPENSPPILPEKEHKTIRFGGK